MVYDTLWVLGSPTRLLRSSEGFADNLLFMFTSKTCRVRHLTYRKDSRMYGRGRAGGLCTVWVAVAILFADSKTLLLGNVVVEIFSYYKLSYNWNKQYILI